MTPLAMSSIAFAFIFGGVLLGVCLHKNLPETYLNSESKEVVRSGTDLVATLAALVLGLLTASAKSSYDTQSAQIRQMTAHIILLDGLLARSGPEAKQVRILLRRSVPSMVDRIWHEKRSAKVAPFAASAAGEAFYEKIQELPLQNDAQRSLQTRAIQAANDLVQTRLIVFAQSDSPLPIVYLGVLVFWLTVIFLSFSVFARPNAMTTASLLISALSASGAIFLILQLNQPFSGLMAISSTALSGALPPIDP